MKESSVTLVNINHASIAELTTISGIGENLAQRITDHRPYAELRELVRVPGINEIKLTTLIPFITLGEKKVEPASRKVKPQPKSNGPADMTTVGNTETFVFLEDSNDRQDALLIIFAGFILGLIILLLRRSDR